MSGEKSESSVDLGSNSRVKDTSGENGSSLFKREKKVSFRRKSRHEAKKRRDEP